MAENNRYRWFRRLGLLASILALAVVMLGAWVRLSDAGLGCPDWPGCYGHLTVPTFSLEISDANQAFPERPVEAHKAWKEMIHRYFAGTLGLLIAGMAFLALRNRRDPKAACIASFVIAGAGDFSGVARDVDSDATVEAAGCDGASSRRFCDIVIIVVVISANFAIQIINTCLPRLIFCPGLCWGFFLLVGQIALGGWTSSNYAALACPDFPTCQGKWWPETDFSEAFVLWRGLGVNYEFGVLEHPARTAIHLTHRIGAVVVTGYLLFLGFVGIRHLSGGSRNMAFVVLLLLMTQVGLGISNVVFHLPLSVAVLHNGVAALLLLALLSFVFLLSRIRGVN